MNTRSVLILGVTASGKGKLAFELAKKLDAEIVSVDSMKVYRRMDIGTAKPPAEFRRQIPYHLIDVAEPSESFSVAEFLNLADNAFEQIQANGKRIIAVGGTALYVKALLFGLFNGPGSDEEIRKKLKQQVKTQGLAGLHDQLKIVDPEAADRIHPNDEKRIIRALEVYDLTGKPISTFQQQWRDTNNQATAGKPKLDWTIIGLRRPKEEENKRINARVKKMIELGLVDEVKHLLAEEKPLSPQARSAIGYAEIIDHLRGKMSLNGAIELIKKNTRRFAKGQRTWFKTFPNVNWLDVASDESQQQTLERSMQLLTCAGRYS